MAQRNGNRGSSGNRSSNNRSSNDSMMSHWGETARDNPMKTAAAAAGAVAAGVFLWSKRNQISDQISRLSDQVSDWAEDMRSSSGSSRELAMTEGPNESSAIESSRATGSRSGRSSSGSSRSRASSTRSAGSQSRSSGQGMTGSTDTMTH